MGVTSDARALGSVRFTSAEGAEAAGLAFSLALAPHVPELPLWAALVQGPAWRRRGARGGAHGRLRRLLGRLLLSRTIGRDRLALLRSGGRRAAGGDGRAVASGRGRPDVIPVRPATPGALP